MMTRQFKEVPPFLFRYRPPDEVMRGYLEDLLRENHIWASPPRGFTDWHDCRAQIDYEMTKKELLRHWRQTFKNFGLKGKALDQALRKITANDAWKDSSKHASITQGIQEALDNSGVICLTDTPLDMRMWDEYAGGHRGICLCFETSKPPFSSTHDVNYVPELPTVKIHADSGEQLEAFIRTKSSGQIERIRWGCIWQCPAEKKPTRPTCC